MTLVDEILSELEAALRLADAAGTPVTPAMLAAFVRDLRLALAGHDPVLAPTEQPAQPAPTPESEAQGDEPAPRGSGSRVCDECEGTGSRNVDGIFVDCDECEGTGAV